MSLELSISIEVLMLMLSLLPMKRRLAKTSKLSVVWFLFPDLDFVIKLAIDGIPYHSVVSFSL